jgi:hypothetical protein
LCCQHLPQGVFAGKENSREVGVEHTLPAFEGHLVDQSSNIDARIGEDAVRCSELLMNEGERSRHLRFVADITRQPYRPACTRIARCGSGFYCTFSIPVEDRNAVTAPSAKQGGGSADTTAAAGNDDEPIGCWHHS